jgi:hypothetical protein
MIPLPGGMLEAEHVAVAEVVAPVAVNIQTLISRKKRPGRGTTTIFIPALAEMSIEIVRG